MPTLQEHLKIIDLHIHRANQLGLEISNLNENEFIDVAVVGEIKKGKSTFLNALVNEKIFPSKSIICTSAVTVLIHADVPAVEITYKNKNIEKLPFESLNKKGNMFDALNSVVSKFNKNANTIDQVVVSYPNQYATNGIRLIDTPGVNDPDSWREEITYRYVGRSDAAIMLLDPQQPLSKSEVEFLKDKIQKRVKDQLLFVVNRIDEVSSPEAREKSLTRISAILSGYVDKPRIFALSAKKALENYTNGIEQDEDFKKFENELDIFLKNGRAGSLLMSRVKVIVDIVKIKLSYFENRISDLEQNRTESEAESIKLENKIRNHQNRLKQIDIEINNFLRLKKQDFINHINEYMRVNSSSALGERTTTTALNHLRRSLLDEIEKFSDQIMKDLIADFDIKISEELSELINESKFGAGTVKLNGFSFTHVQAQEDYTGGMAVAGALFLGLATGGVGWALLGGAAGAALGNSINDEITTNRQLEYEKQAKEYLSYLRNHIESISEQLIKRFSEVYVPALLDPLRRALREESQRCEEKKLDYIKDEGQKKAEINKMVTEKEPFNRYLDDLQLYACELEKINQQGNN